MFALKFVFACLLGLLVRVECLLFLRFGGLLFCCLLFWVFDSGLLVVCC